MAAFSRSTPPFFIIISAYLLLITSALFFPPARSESDTSVIQLLSDEANGRGGEGEAAKACDGATSAANCPVKCFRPDPVCGVDGVTYWCGCADARCSGAEVAKLGFCEVGNGGDSAPFSGQALLLVHIIWLLMLAVLVIFGFF